MKLFNFLTLGAFASEVSISRNRRDVSYSFTGEESAGFFMEALGEISDGTVDDIDAAIAAMMGLSGSDERFLSEVEVRKFRQLKIVVLWLQTEQKFGKYCYYGCYCLPEGSHNIAAGGYGKPLDDIDRACFDFKQCYKCLVEEHNDDRECKGEEIGYRFDLTTDVNGNKDVVCTNKPGSCRYNICQCDVRLAKAFQKYEDDWNQSYHTAKGGFDRDANCVKPVGGGNPVVECCGTTDTFPFNQPRRSHQCCDGPLAKPNGQC